MIGSSFQLEFEKLRFPIRFVLIAFSITFVALTTYYGTSWDSRYSLPHLTHTLIVVGVFSLISLGFLRMLKSSVSNFTLFKGMLVCYIAIIFTAVICCAIIILANELYRLNFSPLDTQYLPPELGVIMVGFAMVFSPALMWLEKRIYSDKQAVFDSETQQFTNLDFRIRPHFLFNSLNSVAGLITQNPSRAETALYNLADVFRAVMADKRQLVPLKAELDMADKYLYLEKIRLGERLQVSSKIDPNAAGIKVPVFLLQPMLENAVYHGIETRFKGGKINLSIQLTKTQLIIRIANPLPEAGVKRRVGNKVAQKNLRQRIIAIFGSRASLDSYEAETSFSVIVKLPL